MRTSNRLASHTFHGIFTLLLAAACLATLPARSVEPTVLRVDARDISQRILHATLHIPAQPGPLTLVYPKWIPGEHGPTGPITDLAGLKMSAAGKSIPWRRDAEDNYAINIDVPPDATAVDVILDFLLASDPNGFSSAASSSANVGALSWNTVLLYPKGTPANSITFEPHVRLPDGWKYATALTRAGESGGEIEFAPVTLETLIDSPLMAGRFVRTLNLSSGSSLAQRLNLIADSAAAMEMTTNDQLCFSNLMVEANALFGAHHYRHYDFLLTLSDEVAHFGLEHHESSDDRVPERMLVDEDIRKSYAYLLPHELVHSWNGKYRRPAGLATPDYQTPMKTELLWVYEGLTEYLGEILTARSGLWTPTNYLENLALTAAMLDHRRGRDWRPLVDTTDAAHLLYNSRGEGASWRRGVDFYPEGAIIWLEADVTIRQLTKGRRSLDDFCQKFFGGESTPPKVVPYTLDDVLAALNTVAPYDWRGFFQQRIYEVNPHAPLGGIENGGWRLIYTDKESNMQKVNEGRRKFTDASYSLGFSLGEEGFISDVIPGSPADRAGIAPGVKLLAVNNRRWTPELLRTAIKEAKSDREPIDLLVENGDVFKNCPVDYHDGERYPNLERDSSKPDILGEILKPRLK
ncbi:MAG TPA: PDZ domain-containing protein [Verrucomicrobiae bacterium]|nr:PDZ domain-containing protein [Verrucomicrobiae bacterium]